MHSIVFAHYLLHSFPAFQPEHVKVVRKILRAFTVEHQNGEVPGTTHELSKVDVQWAVDNSASVGMIAARLHIDLKNESLTPLEPMSEAEMARANAAAVYTKVLFWIYTKLSAKMLDECRNSAFAGLKYLSLPLSQLRKNHERCKVAVSRQRRSTFKLVPEDFVRKEDDEMSDRGLLRGMFFKSK